MEEIAEEAPFVSLKGFAIQFEEVGEEDAWLLVWSLVKQTCFG